MLLHLRWILSVLLVGFGVFLLCQPDCQILAIGGEGWGNGKERAGILEALKEIDVQLAGC
jgi:hypothetical protein